MKLFKYIFISSLLLFAWSVCLTMFNMSGDGTERIMGLPLSYFMLPLFATNLFVIAFYRSTRIKSSYSRVLLIWSVYVSALVLFTSDNIIIDIIRVLLWTSTFFSVQKMCYLIEKFDKYLIFTFVIIFFMGVFYFIQGKLMQINFNSMGLTRGSNTIFCVLTVLPFLLLIKNKWFNIFSIVISLLCVVFSNKRSATLTLAIALMPTLYNLFPENKSKSFKLVAIGLLCLSALFCFVYLSNTYLGGSIFNRLDNIEEDGGSGRTEMWQLVLDRYLNSGIFSQLFGFGHMSVGKLGDLVAAHNDFLEVLYDYGFLGLIIYLLIHVKNYKKIIEIKKTQSTLFSSFFFFFVIFVVMSLVSILIVQQRYLIYMAAFLALIEYKLCNNK